ncbi:MAG: DUF624 domain-containing protein [Maledivibacter sp.]|jgi:uncharacterized membrane protein YesL|nr:DUF624 domain-containing protein [Maledivibacter sp.]
MNIFNIDGFFHRFGTSLFDLMVLNIIFILVAASGFGITFVPACIAMVYTIYESMRKQQGRLLYHFVKGFKENVRQGILLSICFIILSMSMTLVLRNISIFGGYSFLVLSTQYFMIFEISIVSLFLFPMLAKIDLNIKQAIINSFLLAHKHLFTSISCLSLIVLIYYAIKYISPIFIVLAFATVAYVIERLILENIIIKKYVSEDMRRELEIEDMNY